MSVHDERGAVEFMRAALAEYPNQQPIVETAIEDHCGVMAGVWEAPRDCIRQYHDMLGLKDLKPRPLG